MVWLWLLVPLVILAGSAALWWATAALTGEHRALRAEVDDLSSVAPRARGLPRPDRPLPATGPEQVDR